MFERWARILRAWADKKGRGYPDWAMRYLPVLRRWRGRRFGRDRILEIGANENGFARFAEARVIAVDLQPAHLRAARKTQPVWAVAADAAALPFAEHAFDVCVCMDTFEHLPAEARPAAAAEIMRVLNTKGVGVVAFPAGDAARNAERRVQEACRRYTGRTIPWLDEHEAQGLPRAAEIEALFRRVAPSHTIQREGNANLRVWEWMWKVMMCGWPGRGNALFQALLRMLVPALTRYHRPPCYRAVLWLEPTAKRVPD